MQVSLISQQMYLVMPKPKGFGSVGQKTFPGIEDILKCKNPCTFASCTGTKGLMLLELAGVGYGCSTCLPQNSPAITEKS